MPEMEPTVELHEGFSEPDARPRPLHFCAGTREQKTKSLETNPRCVLTTGSNQLRSGLDVVVEGAAVPVTGEAQLQRLAAMWKSKLHWFFEVADGAYRDPDGRVGHSSPATLGTSSPMSTEGVSWASTLSWSPRRSSSVAASS